MATSTVLRVPSPRQLEANKADRVTRMSDIISNIDSKYLLAHPNIIDHVTWQKVGNSDLLVMKSSLEEIGHSSADNIDTPGSIPLGDPAILAMVCKVSSDGTFLALDGGFPSDFTPSLTNIKLTLAVGPASEDPWVGDYEKLMSNLEELLVQVSDD